MAGKTGKKRRRSEQIVPLHTPKRVLHHVADEYEELGNLRIACELRRHLRGYGAAYLEQALLDKAKPPKVAAGLGEVHDHVDWNAAA